MYASGYTLCLSQNETFPLLGDFSESTVMFRGKSTLRAPYLQFPEDAARVPVIVVPQRDVLYSRVVRLQETLHMLEEPRLIVHPNAVDLRVTE